MSRSAEFEPQPSAKGAEPFGLRPLSAIAATGAGGVPQARIRQLLADLIEPLATLHAWGRVHGGIATDTIGRGESGPAQLLDPAGEPVPNGEDTVRRPGFAAFEQYTDDPRSPCGPWTENHALSAVAHSLVTGGPPPEALERRVQDGYVPLAQRAPQGYDPAFLAGIDAGLSMTPSARPQSLEAYAALLALPVAADSAAAPAVMDAAANDEGEPVEEEVRDPAAAPPSGTVREEPRRVSGMAIAAVMAILAVAAFLWLDSDEPPARVARTAPASTPATQAGDGSANGARNGAGSSSGTAGQAASGQGSTAGSAAGQVGSGQTASGQAGSPGMASGQAGSGGMASGQAGSAGTAPGQAGQAATGPAGATPFSGLAANGTTAPSGGAGAASAASAGAAALAVANAAGQGQASGQAAAPAGGGADLPAAPRPPESIISTVTLGGAAPIPERRTAPGPATVQAPPAGVRNAAPVASNGAAQGGTQTAAKASTPGSAQAGNQANQPAGAARTPALTASAAAATPPKAKGPVAVRVDVRPWGEVFIDGKSRGISPPLRELKLPPGKHSVIVQNAGLPPYRVVLDLSDGRGGSISHVFQ